MTTRETKAIEVLRAGGYFRKALERHYFGGEKFATHLYDSNRRRVAGIGVTTKMALEKAGKLASRPCAPSSVWPEEWVINPGEK